MNHGGIWRFFVASFLPVLKLLLVTALGAMLALKRINIMGPQARVNMNNIVFYVFNPALVSSHLASTITYRTLQQMWFMPVAILMTFIVGSLLGWLVLLISRPPRHLHGLIVGCCAAGNLGHMLLIIIPAVCKEKGSPFGASDICYSYGMGYAALSMAVGAVFLWSYVYNIVRISSASNTAISNNTIAGGVELNGSLPDTNNLLAHVVDQPDEFMRQSNPNSQEGSQLTKIKRKVKVLVRMLDLRRLCAPSTMGAMAGFAVGLVPQLRSAFIGETAPLRVIQDTELLLGDGAIPTTTLIMGGNLLKGLQASRMPKSLILWIIVVRYATLPVIGIGIVKAAIRFGWVHSDPLYQFVLFNQFALPPALNIGTITQLFGAGESECSVILLWSYVLASVAVTFWSTLFMWLVAN